MVTERAVLDRPRTQNEQDVGSGPTETSRWKNLPSQTQTTVITGLQQELQRARAGNTRMDPLKLGKPPVFASDDVTYEHWAFKLKAFMGQGSTTAIQWMREMDPGNTRRIGL
eukprot:2975698-Amphidinium_carterae.1